MYAVLVVLIIVWLTLEMCSTADTGKSSWWPEMGGQQVTGRWRAGVGAGVIEDAPGGGGLGGAMLGLFGVDCSIML